MDRARLFQDDRVGARVYAREIADEPWGPWRVRAGSDIPGRCGGDQVSS